MHYPQSGRHRDPQWPEATDPGDRAPTERLASADDLQTLWLMAQSGAFGANPGDALALLSERNPRALDGEVSFHPLTACARFVRRIWSGLTGRPERSHPRSETGTGVGRGTEHSFHHRDQPT